jgi:cytochrome c peroxidase
MVLALGLSGCNGTQTPTDAGADDGSRDSTQLTETELRALLALPPRFSLPAIPGYNPISKEKIELGRFLFYDMRLSANQTQSCSSCHLQQLAFSDGERTPTGSTGQRLHRNSPGLANVAYFSTLTWANPALLDLEDQLPVPILSDNPIELGVSDGAREEVLGRFDADPGYSERFKVAFPHSMSGATIDKIVSGKTPFDRYLEGDKSALTDSQRRGYGLFSGERLECFHCHSGTNLTVSYRSARTTPSTAHYPFFNDGLYNLGGRGDYPANDQGLYDVTFDPADRGLFRPPSLRNIALTAPYMHDGSVRDLRGVLH